MTVKELPTFTVHRLMKHVCHSVYPYCNYFLGYTRVVLLPSNVPRVIDGNSAYDLPLQPFYYNHAPITESCPLLPPSGQGYLRTMICCQVNVTTDLNPVQLLVSYGVPKHGLRLDPDCRAFLLGLGWGVKICATAYACQC